MKIHNDDDDDDDDDDDNYYYFIDAHKRGFAAIALLIVGWHSTLI